MPVRQEDIERVILDIHAAPLEEARWWNVIDSLRRMVDAHQAILFTLPLARGESFWNVRSESDPAITADYAREFAPEDTWGLAAKQLPGPIAGRIMTGEQLVPRSEFLRTRFFNEFLRRYDIDRFLCTVLRDPPFRGAPVGASLSLYRGLGSQAFGAQEQEALSRVAPHLVIALKTFWELRALSLRNSALTKSLDAVAVALFVVDRTGRIVFENEAGRSALQRGHSLSMSDTGKLIPSPKVREQKACSEAIRNLLAGRGATVRLTVSPDEEVIVSTAPLSESSDISIPFSGAAGLVWLVPLAPSSNPIKRITSLFALTAAEARLLAPLSAGSPLGEVAASLAISIHTARAQLKSIQRKTGWRTQSELVRMIQQLSLIDP